MKLFAALPYGAVQMDMVAHEASVAKPTLYRYFKTKEALFLTALDAFLGEFASVVGNIAASFDAPELALTEIISFSFDKFAGCSAALRAADGSESGVGGQGRRLARERIDEIRGSITHVLRRGAATGRFNDSEPETTALILLGALRVAAVRTPPHRRDAVLNHIQSVLLNGVVRRDPPRSTFATEVAEELEQI